MTSEKRARANPAAAGGIAPSCCAAPRSDDRNTSTDCCGGPAPQGADACCLDDAEAKAAGTGGCGCGSSRDTAGR